MSAPPIATGEARRYRKERSENFSSVNNAMIFSAHLWQIFVSCIHPLGFRFPHSEHLRKYFDHSVIAGRRLV